VLSWSFAAAAVVLVLVTAAIPARVRPAAVTLLSIAAVGRLWHVPVLAILAGSAAVFALGRLLPRVPPRPRGALLAAGIVGVLAVLARFKVRVGPTGTLASTSAVVGLSYLSLKLVQHLVDAASGRARTVDLIGFLSTVFFLPTYPAGPIERTTEFTPALARSDLTGVGRLVGVERVVIGLGRKFLLADPLLRWAAPLLGAASGVAPLRLLAAVDAFALALYLDFAAYSDLAIGIARLAGVRVRENFDNPYLRRNVALLWQHWHMSLTSWLRDFVFVPTARRVLRATRRPLLSQVTAQIITMIACGLWHGVSWNFVVWGLYQAAGLGGHAAWRAWRGSPPTNAPVRDVVATVATFQFFAVGLVLFACDVPSAARVVTHLLGFS
jgi:alginate O-acetyltransferase complex protein AlgI